MSRKAHPCFGYKIRLEAVRKEPPSGRSAVEPLLKPENEPGILWDAFRNAVSPRPVWVDSGRQPPAPKGSMPPSLGVGPSAKAG